MIGTVGLVIRLLGDLCLPRAKKRRPGSEEQGARSNVSDFVVSKEREERERERETRGSGPVTIGWYVETSEQGFGEES